MPLLNRDRIPFVISLVLAIFCLTLYTGHLVKVWWPILQSQSLMAPKISTPVALDFPLHWTASFLALSGEPASVYDFPRLQKVEKELTGYGPHPWPYPPTGLLIDLPLALAPYFVSLAIWLTVTMWVYLWVVYRIAPHPLTIFLTLAFLGTFENFYFGQNGFLSATLLGGGLLLLANNPLVAGLLLGLLSYKPHIFALIPLALLVGRQWRALVWAVVSGLGLFLASVAVFGCDIWQVFLKNIPSTVHNLHTEALWFDKMPSVFAAVRFGGYGVALAWICQGVTMFAAVALVIWIWSGPATLALRAAALVLAILLFSPHIWYYDLTLLALPLAWFWQDGRIRGWPLGEQLLLILSWIMPLVTFLVVVSLHWPVGPLYLVAPFILLLRCYRREKGQEQMITRWGMASDAVGSDLPVIARRDVL